MGRRTRRALTPCVGCPGVFENTLGLPSERVKRNQDGIASLGPDDHNFVAVTPDGTVIGVVGLKVRPQLRMRHTADVGIFVHTDLAGGRAWVPR